MNPNPKVATNEDHPQRSFQATRGATLRVLTRLLAEGRSLAATHNSLHQRLRQILVKKPQREAFRRWLHWCAQDATDEQPISSELSKHLSLHLGTNRGREYGRLTLLRECRRALDAMNWSYESHDPLEADPDQHKIETLLISGLNLSFVNHNAGRQESNYHWLLADLLPPRIILGVMRGFTLPDETGTNEWAVENALAARHDTCRFEETRPTVLHSGLADLCGTAEMEDVLTGKQSVFLLPVFGRQGQHPIGTLYLAFPVPGLFVHEELQLELPFVYQLWARIAGRYCGELVASARYESTLDVQNVSRVVMERTFLDHGFGAIDIMPKLLPDLLKFQDAPGFLIGAHAKVGPAGGLQVDVGVQEKAYFDHLFNLLRTGGIYPKGWLPNYVRDMERRVRDGGPEDLVHSVQVSAGGNEQSVDELKDLFRIYSNLTGVHDLVLGIGCRDAGEVKTLGALRLNYTGEQILDRRVGLAAQTAFEAASEAIGATLIAFERAIETEGLDIQTRRTLIDARKALFESVCNILMPAPSSGRPAATADAEKPYDRGIILKDALGLISPQTGLTRDLRLLLESVEASRMEVEAFFESFVERADLGLGKARLANLAVLASGWGRWPRFIIEDKPEELTFSRALRDANLLRFLQNVMDVLRWSDQSQAHFRFQRHSHQWIGKELIVVPAIRHCSAAEIRLVGECRDTAEVRLYPSPHGQATTVNWRRTTSLGHVTYCLKQEGRHLQPSQKERESTVIPTSHGAWHGEQEDTCRASLDELFVQLEERSVLDWCRDLVRSVEHREISTEEALWRVISVGETPEDGVLIAFGRHDMPGKMRRESEELSRIRDAALKFIRNGHLERDKGWDEGFRRARRKHTHAFSGKLDTVEWFFQDLCRKLEQKIDTGDRSSLRLLARELRRLKHRCRLDDLWFRRKNFRLPPEKVDLLAYSLETLGLLKAPDNVRLTRDLPTTGGLVYAPEPVVHLVVDELLINAFDYLGAAELPDPELAVGLEPTPHGLMFYVENTVRSSMTTRLEKLWSEIKKNRIRAVAHEDTWGFGVGISVLFGVANLLPSEDGEGLGLDISDQSDGQSAEGHEGRVRISFTFPIPRSSS